eukprot:CAMPEP_0196724108 /NCGR_PEP_ID=MMETSP1091-20130531/6108_1 /TAXON_ID=302021 /ORGANISM="Rhodomonas sp., Strain CCMP768" /LENGTH=180 /DNA_ID=CAMNT_0042066205 /DNA_START=9 /DNA_END=551 /DNA_ORIENTATION=+
MAQPTYNSSGAMPVLPSRARGRQTRPLVTLVQAASILVLVACMAALASIGQTQRRAQLLQLVPAARNQALFQTPDDAAMDASSWMLNGIIEDNADTPEGFDPLDLDKSKAKVASRPDMLYEIAAPSNYQTLLGGDDWLGAPLAVPDDVREHGEQQIGEEVTYWNTHSGNIGTGGGSSYPY